ncbi:MAG: Tat pathway signal protein [Verrucomicrobia bacterium]|nr:MAG: Tat pathway signal protein [Verrucomicrobiota bacterium]TAE89402.1 MAG: Tat pathway signal protein [Verrucomicrobiota bacterium]TAF28097.1 MAG: Tat pathway signal protein [Verrucomicrobiota bacterium]TAF42945.1 MAG: Tat pathway signal protein [Verrucomicrobiota bacterium]
MPEPGQFYQHVRPTDITTIVARVDFQSDADDNITIWLNPDLDLAESEQNPALVTSFTANANFDAIFLREAGERGDGWTFSEIAIAENPDDPGFFGKDKSGDFSPPFNLALVATASASQVSVDTSVAALNDDKVPANSLDRGPGCYGNGPSTDTRWVQFDWTKPISTNSMEVFWWDDQQGVRIPAAYRVKYWTGSDFAEVSSARGLGLLANVFNRTTFDTIRTTRLRLEIDGAETFSTGILEWRVIDSGDSPVFPPKVVAGVDRTVVLGGKTYLRGETKAWKHAEEIPLRWRKVSGPGTVIFADANAAQTTATFSALGEYRLALDAKDGEQIGTDELLATVVAAPTDERLDVVYTTPYSIDNPLWNDRAKALIVHWIPHCIDHIEDRSQDTGGIENFEEAAKAVRGEPHAPHKGLIFSNAWVHQTVESMCIALMVDAKGDKEILAAQERFRKTLESWIPIIISAQEPDGYLQTAYTLADRNQWRERWDPAHRENHEGYVAGYFIESAINHFTLTNGKDRRLYDAAKKLADCWVANIGAEQGKKAWHDEHQQMEQGLVRFGRFVNDVEHNGRGDAYIKLAKFLLDNRGHGADRQKYDQSHLPVREQYEAVGHAVRAVYSYSGMADVAAETGDADYKSAVMSLWDNIVNRKYYVTGGIGSGETSEGFGADYSLGHGAYCESCSSCGLIFFQYKLNLAYRDAKFADLYEETMYNALLGSVDLAGKNFYYQNPLDTNDARHPWHVCPCCVGNIPRTLLMVPTWTYAKDRKGINANLFIGSTIQVGEVAGTTVEMVQKTDYPWDGKVAMTVNPAEPREFELRIRIPNRDVSALYKGAPDADGLKEVELNGQPVAYEDRLGYAVIRRIWKKGDTVRFTIPMVAQKITASDKIAATRGQMAFRYGPIVYCVERADQDIQRPIDPDAPLQVEWQADTLNGIKVIRGKWADGSELRAIPYYARANREDSASRLWLPIK